MILKLEPDVSHCIQTVAKKEYEKVLSLLLKNDQADVEKEETLELLKLFLESADFGKLRMRCDEFLLKGKRVAVTLKSCSKANTYEIELHEAS